MEIETRRILFVDLNQVVCHTEAATLLPPSNGVIIETRFSCISAGTELAKLTGLQNFAYPGPIGNRAIGRVLEKGEQCRHVEVGDLVFTHSHHASHSQSQRLIAPLPDSLDCPEAAMLGMAMVAITGIRVARPEIGDCAVVIGAGLVGQFVAQLLELNGVRAIVVDPSPGRLATARECGAWQTVEAGEDASQSVLELTDGRGAEHVLECTGIPAVAEAAVAFAAQSAQVVLVGSPRGEHMADMTPFLNSIHLWRDQGDLTLKGAHEWKIPVFPVHGGKHSLLRNARILTELVESDRLSLKPLLSHLFEPGDCQQAYDLLRPDRDACLGVVFDWTCQ